MVKDSDSPTPGLLERLSCGSIICAEGYVFELGRRGYLQAGATRTWRWSPALRSLYSAMDPGSLPARPSDPPTRVD